MTRVLASVVLIGALLFETACGQSQVTETLALVVAAASAAIDVADPALAPVVAPYLTGVTNAVDFAATELASTDTDAVKAAKIAQEFASVAAPNLPPGTALTIVTVIGAVATAVKNFLGTVAATSATLEGNAAYVESFAAKGKGLKMSSADQKAIAKIQVENAKARAKLAKLKKQN